MGGPRELFVDQAIYAGLSHHCGRMLSINSLGS